MARRPRTYSFRLGVPVTSIAPDIELSAAARSAAPQLDITAQSREYKLKPDRVGTTGMTMSGDVAIASVPMLSGEQLNVSSSAVDFRKVDMIETSKSLDVQLPPSPAVHRIDCRPLDKVDTSISLVADHLPVTLHALDTRHIPYPTISEFIIKLAENAETSYTKIKFIGAFDPVPIHLARDLKLDADRGILTFYFREEPVRERQFARVVYGRIRLTGKIISAVFPVM